MSITVDARGLSCPQPVMMTLDAIKSAGSGEIIIVVDNDTAKENVCRAAAGRGWTIADIGEESEIYQVTIRKG